MSELIVNTISGLNDLSVGNTTVNSTVNSTSFSIGNTTVNSTVNSTSFSTGDTNITGDTLSVGNTTVNSTVNSTSFSTGNTSITGDTLSVGNSTVNSTSFSTGDTSITGDTLSVGNSTVNTAITSSGITQNGLNFRVPKNYIVNPGMRISQENGTSSGTTNGYYPADQWFVAHSQDGTLTSQHIGSATPGGSENRIRMTVTSADTSIAAGQYALFMQYIEGLRTADLQWGTSNATDVVVRFGFKGPAGTYAVAIVNQDSNRSFVREFTISGGDANTDTLQTVTFPGDTSGTWDKDNTTSFQLIFTFATGSTYQTTADAWQAGNYFGTSTQSNGIGTTSDVFEIFDVGLYADPDSTGLAPRFELPHYDTDLKECKRYFDNGGDSYFRLYHADANPTSYNPNIMGTLFFDQEMRATPSIATQNRVDTSAAVTIVTIYRKTAWVNVNGSSAGHGTYFQWHANARL